MITNTSSVGVVRDAVLAWHLKRGGQTLQAWGLPVVAETWDGWLNDIAGAPVGEEIPEGAFRRREGGSIIVVVATDAPLVAHQLKRLARRAALGLARTGSTAGNGSGDIFVAFSTANEKTATAEGVAQLAMLPNDRMNPLFDATVQATEEAITNALVAAETMTGVDDHTVLALPHDRLKDTLKKYNRLAAPKEK